MNMNMTNDRNAAPLTKGAIAPHVLWLAFPMLWGLLAVSINILIDTYFVAQLGTTALAALSFIFPVIMVVQSIAVSAQHRLSRALSAKGIGER